jgi:hypothetical protein
LGRAFAWHWHITLLYLCGLLSARGHNLQETLILTQILRLWRAVEYLSQQPKRLNDLGTGSVG